MVFEDDVALVDVFSATEFRLKWATLLWEEREAHKLRRAVFCVEQGIFLGDDRNAIDEHAQLIVAMVYVGVMPDQVVGTVRIHEDSPSVWIGSGLAVRAAFRNHSRLGATLIRLAVSSAHALGCRTFLAHVQSQNVPLFERLNWRSHKEEMLYGRPLHLMQADLNAHPPCHDTVSGFVMRGKSSK